MDHQRLLAALAEPSRLRIVELLAASPRTVGEIAVLLDARQPQTTKHLQTLETAGVVTIHRLGTRRVASLQRDALRALSDWLASLAVAHPSEPVLEQYRRSIEVEQVRATTAPARRGRTFEIRDSFPASPPVVWRAWTTPRLLVRRWWSPDHFAVTGCDVEPIVGGRLRIEMGEGDGVRHVADGEFLVLRPDHELQFALAPCQPDGRPMFEAIHTLTLEPSGNGTDLSLVIRVSGISKAAAPAIAGIQIGWQQSLRKLAAVVAPTA